MVTAAGAVIRAAHLSKRYRIGMRQPRPDTLRDALVGALGAPWRRRAAGPEVGAAARDTIWALQDVTFEVAPGKVLGIIGRNGAGKSTLLKLLARITEPTAGWAEIQGRVGSLLEVGTGFHPELSGRENIYLNGAILGMKRAEIARRFDEIVDFAEVARFVDTPVKHYSSGMYLRLAFAVAAHLEPEILLVDEVLAVGDAAFQRKCLNKMGSAAEGGRTILFVSHNMGAIRRLCDQAILLEDGAVVMQGPAAAVIDRYLTSNLTYEGFWARQAPLPAAPGLYVQEIAVESPDGLVSGHVDPARPFTIRLGLSATTAVDDVQVAVRVTNQEGIPVFTTANSDARSATPPIARGAHTYRIGVPAHLLPPGAYSILVGVLIPQVRLIDVVENEIGFLVEDLGGHATALRDGRLGVVSPLLDWVEA